MYKVVEVKIIPETNESGKQKHLLVSKNGGKRKLTIPVYKKQVIIIKDDLSFEEAKALRKENPLYEIIKYTH